MNEVPQDIPSPVDFHSVEAAQAWAKEAEQKLPSRLEFFNFFVAELTLGQPHTVLELGSGPGFLAEYILTRCPFIHHYVLNQPFDANVPNEFRWQIGQKFMAIPAGLRKLCRGN